jgi:hypothetical protein
MEKDEVAISGVWLRTSGGHVQVLVEIDGRWLLVNDEKLHDGERTVISHITETSGIEDSPFDPMGSEAA